MAESTDGRGRRAPPRWMSDHRDLSGRPFEGLTERDLERLAVSSYLIGDDEGCIRAWTEAHNRHADAGNRADAAICSFWLAFCLMMRGQMSQAGAWLGRTESTIGDGGPCRASGYLLIPALLRALDAGEPATARDLAAGANAIAEQFADPDLAAFAHLGDGQALIAMGEVQAGLARLDEAMLGVASEGVGPIAAGVVYCAVILECMQVFDLARAAEWTDALSAWCEDQPDLVPYRGQCLVHRSQLQQAAGDWSQAVSTARAACDRLTDPTHPALGQALYQVAELHRLRGELKDAATAYAAANANGREPMPGLALLQLDRGNSDAAASSILRALREPNHSERPRLLAAAVEILRETRDMDGARRAVDELCDIADRSSSEVLRAMADRALGAVLLGEGDTVAALTHLRSARSAWSRLRMPHDAARTSVLLGLGCLALDDRASADLEFDNARATFDRLGARPDADRLHRLQSAAAADSETDDTKSFELSARELEVLGHVAAGETNREIAASLHISQHTVGRHLENIFAKLGVKGRAAATAHAYETGLL